MNFDPPSSKSPKKPVPVALLVVGALVLAAAFFGESSFILKPSQGEVLTVRLIPGYFIGILQLVVVGAIGYWFGKMKSAGDLAPDEDAPSVTERLRAIAKSDKDRKLAGVCGGLGEHTPLPAWIWRVAFVLFTFAHAFGLLIYVILAFAMPDAGKVKLAKPADDTPVPPESGNTL